MVHSASVKPSLDKDRHISLILCDYLYSELLCDDTIAFTPLSPPSPLHPLFSIKVYEDSDAFLYFSLSPQSRGDGN